MRYRLVTLVYVGMPVSGPSCDNNFNMAGSCYPVSTKACIASCNQQILLSASRKVFYFWCPNTAFDYLASKYRETRIAVQVSVGSHNTSSFLQTPTTTSGLDEVVKGMPTKLFLGSYFGVAKLFLCVARCSIPKLCVVLKRKFIPFSISSLSYLTSP